MRRARQLANRLYPLPRFGDNGFTVSPTTPDSPAAAPDSRSVSVFEVVWRTAIWNVYLVLASLFFGFLACFVGWLPPRGDWAYQLARMWSRGWLWLAGVRPEVSRESELDPSQGYVFLANHQSYFDIPTLIHTLPGQTRFMAKRGLFQIPIFGWALHAGGFIPVDRRDRKSGRATFAAALDRLSRGRSVLIFPEETRSRDGRLLPFKRGGILLALKSGYPIVPVGISGTAAVQPPGSLRVRPGPVTVRYGMPIEVADFAAEERRGLAVQVRAEVERLRGEAPSQGVS